MKPTALRAIPFAALCACVCALMAACGSSTKTVTASSVPPASQTASTAPAKTTLSTTTQAQTTSTSATTPSTSTRAAPEPAFTQQEAKAEGVSAAAAIVRGHGFTPNDTADYRSGQALRVLVGTRSGSADGYGQQAFFFVDGRYIGTDSTAPSAKLRVVSQSDTQVTLAYPLYRSHDALCCPSGGEARVTFELDNGKLTPLQPIPPSSSATGLSRQ
jgi:hypothetical protein